jgi:hypothetical protein
VAATADQPLTPAEAVEELRRQWKAATTDQQRREIAELGRATKLIIKVFGGK